MTDFKLIVTIVNSGFSTQVMDAAREAGATGGTIIYSSGAGAHEAEKLFGIAVSPEKETVLILSPASGAENIMRSVIKKTGLNTLGAGLCFALNVDSVFGVAYGINGGGRDDSAADAENGAGDADADGAREGDAEKEVQND